MAVVLTCILVVLPKVYSTDDVHVVIVDRIPAEQLFIDRQNTTHIVVGLVDCLIFGRRLALCPHQRSGKLELGKRVLSVVDCTVQGMAFPISIFRGRGSFAARGSGP